MLMTQLQVLLRSQPTFGTLGRVPSAESPVPPACLPLPPNHCRHSLGAGKDWYKHFFYNSYYCKISLYTEIMEGKTNAILFVYLKALVRFQHQCLLFLCKLPSLHHSDQRCPPFSFLILLLIISI